MDSLDLNELQAQIKNKEDFTLFLRYFMADLKQNPDDWENSTLEKFLEAMSAWIDDMEGYYQNQKTKLPEVDWKFLAQLFLASRIYE